MMRFSLAILVAVLGWSVFVPSYVSAAALKVAPLEYRTTLKKGEKQKGFIDISNPSPETVKVQVSVQAFRYIDDKPTLEFYDNEQLSAGVRTDLNSFTLKSRQAIRMFFQIDGLKLPSGDVYATIFFTTQPAKQQNGVSQQVKLGTLLSIVNGTPGSRKATITKLDVPFIQIGEEINGSYTMYNPADPRKNTGFYPETSVKLWPGSKEKNETAKLLFAGRSRTNEIQFKDIGFGLHRVRVIFGKESKDAWVFTASNAAVALMVFVLIVVGAEYALHLRRKKLALQRSKRLKKQP